VCRRLVDVSINTGLTPLHSCCDRAVCRRLVDVTTNTGLTPLHYAAWKGRADILKQLVNAGACSGHYVSELLTSVTLVVTPHALCSAWVS
jgi:hypothetical protein